MSALDGRIRTIAREEAAGLLGGAPTTQVEGDAVAELRDQVAALTTRLDALEAAASAPSPAKRATRKTAESGE